MPRKHKERTTKIENILATEIHRLTQKTDNRKVIELKNKKKDTEKENTERILDADSRG